ncbi:MAG TPA: hypothetical protein VNE41_07080 [Chitinophagaceae bacterium]|nr:hypothetical protein [Chitinophagaceae bacterium]
MKILKTIPSVLGLLTANIPGSKKDSKKNSVVKVKLIPFNGVIKQKVDTIQAECKIQCYVIEDQHYEVQTTFIIGDFGDCPSIEDIFELIINRVDQFNFMFKKNPNGRRIGSIESLQLDNFRPIIEPAIVQYFIIRGQ